MCEWVYSHEITCTGYEGTLFPAWLIAITVTEFVSPQLRGIRVQELVDEEQFCPVKLKATYCSAPWAGSHDTTIPASGVLVTTSSMD